MPDNYLANLAYGLGVVWYNARRTTISPENDARSKKEIRTWRSRRLYRHRRTARHPSQSPVNDLGNGTRWAIAEAAARWEAKSLGSERLVALDKRWKVFAKVKMAKAGLPIGTDSFNGLKWWTRR